MYIYSDKYMILRNRREKVLTFERFTDLVLGKVLGEEGGRRTSGKYLSTHTQVIYCSYYLGTR